MLIIINLIIFSHFVVGLEIFEILKIKPRETQRLMDGWMDGPTVESRGHPMPRRLPLLERSKKDIIFKLGSKRLCFALVLFIVVVFGIAIELH